MNRRSKHPAPEGFLQLLREGMEKRAISLNHLAARAGISPAFLSRILNKERGLPSDKAILRLARVLDLQPAERLLIEAGRMPEELKPMLSQPQMPALLRAAGDLNENDLKELLKIAQSLAVRQHNRERA